MCAIKFQNQLLGIQTELMRFAIKLTCDVEEANDLLQETFLKALDNESKFADDTNFRGWMYTIMRNIFINNYRRYTRDRTYVDRSENQYQINTPRDLCSRVTEENYDLKEIRRALNRLPTEYRIPFSMHVAGFKYREIADRLELPLGTVKSRIFFTRQRLQVQLVDFL
jgi:RNA polymerase sigma-70 factor (ECF subfamily)